MEVMSKNYTEESMSFSDGFTTRRSKVIGKRKTINKELAKLIIDYLILKGNNVQRAECGLLTDWQCTSFTVFKNNNFKYLVGSGHDTSDWAIPALIVFFEDGTNEMYHCFN
tara:strand:- start:341 stop:673 length:333 start_codon:yes stop_codon:yes gene_type:complete